MTGSVRLKAAAAFNRNEKEIADSYTAAAILASGAVSETLAGRLRKIVMKAIVQKEDGSKVLLVPKGVVRDDGLAPSQLEATALAVLALQDSPGLLLIDLGSTLLSSYTPSRGWGDGRANLVCMKAVLKVFKDPIPQEVNIQLSKDGKLVVEGKLHRENILEVLEFVVKDLDVTGENTWQVSAMPAIPGVGFSLDFTRWVPWKKEISPGLEFTVTAPEEMVIGEASKLTIQAVAPSNTPFSVQLEMPAGLQVDRSSLEALVHSGVLRHYEWTDETLTIEASPLQPATRFSALIRVIPTLGGLFQSGAAVIRMGGVASIVPPFRVRVHSKRKP